MTFVGTNGGGSQSAIRNPQSAIVSVLLAVVLIGGCGRGPRIIPDELRKPIDRSLVEFPSGMRLERFIEGLRAPTAIAFDTQKNALLVAESGTGGVEPGILGFSFNDGGTFRVYQQGKVLGPLRSIPFRMYGPIGGMVVRDGVIYVSHRDKDDFGVISAVTYDGKGTTVVAGLPAQGDHGVTDLVFGPTDGRLYFGVGSATNSGVVGLDNWAAGWVQRHRDLADHPYGPVRLRGSRFNTTDPRQGLFSDTELAITGPFQPFGEFHRTSIVPVDGSKPNAAIYSVQPTGGIATDLIVEAHGVRMPAGLAWNESGLFASNRGMELRGSRPVKDDPDSILRISPGRYYGWPDASADLRPITDMEFKPPESMLRPTGYLELAFLLEHTDKTVPPFSVSEREALLEGVFPPLSGAAKMTFLPRSEGPLAEYSRNLVVALSGDRAPFANSGKKLRGPVGYKVVRLDLERNAPPQEFIRNTANVPRSMAKRGSADMLERPVDVKVGPDGYLYVLDFGRMEVKAGKEHVIGSTGQVFRLLPADAPTTGPSPRPPESEFQHQ
jgi:glucose/arabinose dehydrogenase